MKFDDAGQFSKSFRQLAATNKAIEQAVCAYKENMERLASLWELPINLARFVSGIREAYARRYPASRGGTFTSRLPTPASQTPRERKATEKQRKLDEEYAKYPSSIDYGHDQLNEIFQRMLGPLPDTTPEKTTRGCDTIFFAMTIGAWTAFETLAGDLWEQCLNARPRLGFVALDAEPAPTDDEATKEAKRTRRFSIPVNLLRKWNYNVRNRMGSLTRSKWTFTRRAEALDAYVKAFGKAEQHRFNAIFESNGLKWLAATRHCLVHRGGIADSDFRKQVTGHKTLGAIKERAPIVLSGDLVKEFVEEVVVQSADLIAFVDGWLTNNKQ
jgi:hypothetical protein